MANRKRFDLGIERILQQGARLSIYMVHPKLVNAVRAYLRKLWNKGE